jgi:hypothetical protein
MALTNATPLEVAKAARLGSRQLAVLSTADRNSALTAIHGALADGKDEVLAANRKDLDEANKAAAGGTLSVSLVKRLDLGKPGKYEDMLQGILDVRDLEDPSMHVIFLFCSCLSIPRLFNVFLNIDLLHYRQHSTIIPVTNTSKSTRLHQKPFSTTT